MGEGVSLLFKFINFAVLLAILIKFGGKPLKQYIRKRHEDVKDKIEEADRLLKEAGQTRQLYEEKLSRLESEIESFRKSVFDDMEKETTKILDEARSLAVRIREQAELAYGQEMKDAMTKVRAEIASRTITAAEQKVQQAFGKDDHERMVEEFIEKVRSLN
jgi:F-type H+-transporting ATPase subunit b